MKPDDLITARQIAAHAGVTTQAVSIWRKHDDFPEQWVPGYYEWRTVERWLLKHGKVGSAA